MNDLSTDELSALGDQFGVPIEGREAEEIETEVNALLESLDGLEELPLPETEASIAGRSWRVPEDDPCNALVVECEIRPPTEAAGLLAGVSVGVKDIIAVAGVPMQCSSAVMSGFVPTTDATVVDRLLDAGASIDAMTTCDEFAASARGTTPVDGPVLNPRDTGRTAGGSSGGSAAAVATGRVDVALGTDTGGSVRIPASFCGVVGLKPTYGLVPLSGVVENTYTQDHVGPLAVTVAEAARTLEAIAGPADSDPASLLSAGRPGARYGGYVGAAANPPAVSELAIGRLEPGFGEGVAASTVERIDSSVDRLADAGATIEQVEVEGFEYGPAVKNTLSVVELAAHWRAGGAAYRRGGLVDPDYQADLAARIDAAAGELGPYYKSKLIAGAHVIESRGGVPYSRAQAARETLRERFEAALAGVDALVLPTTPDVAPRLEVAADPGFDYARNTRAADVTRLPAITLPAGTVDDLPVGIQLIGRAFGETQLLGAAAAVEDQLREA